MEAHKVIYEVVKARGYTDGWTPGQLLARQLVKLQEEVGEAQAHCLVPPGELAPVVNHARHLARVAFRSGWWDRAGVSDLAQLKEELADCMVVLLMAQAAVEQFQGEDWDLTAAALSKAQADVPRGVS